ncbi:uncharacterized protein METZ01_LOCUS255061, partial [marine metagenome]
ISSAVPSKLHIPEDTDPRTFYGAILHIDKKWRDGVIWSLDGYKKRLEIEEEFPPPL